MILLLQATVGVGTLRVGPQLHAGEIVTQGIVAHVLRHLTKLQQVPAGTGRRQDVRILKSSSL